MPLWSRFTAIFSRRVESELDEELRDHLAREEQQNLAAGMTPSEAKRRAALAFGGAESIKEECREARPGYPLQTLWQDVRFGLRMLRKNPGYAAVAIGMLALGIGANTAIFSLTKSLLLAPLPFRNPSQIVLVREGSTTDRSFGVSPANLADYRAQQRTFENLSLWMDQSVNLTGRDRPDRVIGSFVSTNYFRMLGAGVLRGRDFNDADEVPGAAGVAIVSYPAWQTRFGADPDLIGKQVTLNGETCTIIGILPREFRSPISDDDVYLTIQHYPNFRAADRSARVQLMFGRIRDGVSHEQATADLTAIGQRIARDNPQYASSAQIVLEDIRALRMREIRPMLFVLMAAVGVVLLIACANVANLMLMRGAARAHELSIRAALGASRRRIAQQLGAEALVTAIPGGLAALFVAYWTLRLLLKINPVPLPWEIPATLDLPLLAFALALSLLTGVLAGIVPALQLSRPDVVHGLGASSRTSTGSARRAWVRGAFVVGQVAMSLVLLVGAGLLVKTLLRLTNTNPGFDTSNLLTLQYRVPRNKYTTAAAQWEFHRRVVESVQHVPGVTSAALIQAMPFSGNWGELKFRVPGRAVAAGSEPSTLVNLVTTDFFATFRVPLLRGRVFDPQDTVDKPQVAVINRTLQEKYWPGGDAIGQPMDFLDNNGLTDGTPASIRHVTVIGVVGDTKHFDMRDERQAQVYFAYSQQASLFANLVVRTAGEPLALIDDVRKAVWAVDKDQPVWRITSMEGLMNRDIAPQRALVALIVSFGVLALLLTAAGAYGLISHSVNQRRQEIGIRMALGASSGRVMSMIFGEGLRLAAIGVVIGVAGALGASQLFRTLLFGVSATDPGTLAAGTGLMILVALLSCWVPARRATRTDPAVALRWE